MTVFRCLWVHGEACHVVRSLRPHHHSIPSIIISPYVTAWLEQASSWLQPGDTAASLAGHMQEGYAEICRFRTCPTGRTASMPHPSC